MEEADALLGDDEQGAGPGDRADLAHALVSETLDRDGAVLDRDGQDFWYHAVHVRINPRGRPAPVRPLTDEEVAAASVDDLRAAYRDLRLRIDRIVAALASRREQGLFTGGLPPYGFALGDDGEQLVQVATEQRAAVRARALRQRGLSLRDVARQLEEEGLFTRNGRRFAPTQVNRMIRTELTG